MAPLSDSAVRHLQRALDVPDAGERYVVLEEIGRGGMGAVYRAMDESLGREVALKALAFEGNGAGVAERLAREARVLAQLEHPGIVPIHDVGVLADGRPYYVMRLVLGSTLAQHIGGRGRGELLRLFLQVCDAVAFANARGVIHRDLTPGNVMIGAFGEVLLVDWGVARVLAAGDNEGRPRNGDLTGDGAPEAHPVKTAGPREPPSGATLAADELRTAEGVVVGTPGFMPPEQASGAARNADQRADVYGLGAILRVMLKEGDGAIPSPLAAIAAHATATSPDDRYPSALALASDVRRWLDDEPVAAYRENVFERFARFFTRNRPLILLLLAYAIVRLIILLWRGV